MMFPMSGVISENSQVIATTAGDPMAVPFGNVGSGSVAGRVQLIAAASAVIRRSYSAWAARLPGAAQAVGLMAAKLAASRTALVSVTQPRKTRPKSTPNRTISMTTGKLIANSTRPWPRGSSRKRRRPGVVGRARSAALGALRGARRHADKKRDPPVPHYETPRPLVTELTASVCGPRPPLGCPDYRGWNLAIILAGTTAKFGAGARTHHPIVLGRSDGRGPVAPAVAAAQPPRLLDELDGDRLAAAPAPTPGPTVPVLRMFVNLPTRHEVPPLPVSHSAALLPLIYAP